MKKLLIVSTIILIALGGVEPNQAQVTVNKQLDIVFRNPSGKDYSNKTFAGFSNFDLLRLRLFFDAALADDKVVFTQILFDNKRVTLYGAYIRFTNILDRNLNLNLGLIPNPFGTFGPRTYADKNPLIGTPLVYNYHTAFSLIKSLDSVDALRAIRGQGYANYGLPILYDFCWNSGLEIYGNKGNIDWSLGALSGSVSAPTLSIKKDIPQFMGRLGFYFTPEFSLHLSGFTGPYISQYPERDDSLEVNDFLNSGGGFSIHYRGAYLDIYSEIFGTQWEQPYYETLSAASGYLEIKYKFIPQWYLAARGGAIRFSTIDFGGNQGTESWDYPLDRYEFGVGYHIDRRMVVKLVIQDTRSSVAEELNDTIVAIQISASL